VDVKNPVIPEYRAVNSAKEEGEGKPRRGGVSVYLRNRMGGNSKFALQRRENSHRKRVDVGLEGKRR